MYCPKQSLVYIIEERARGEERGEVGIVEGGERREEGESSYLDDPIL